MKSFVSPADDPKLMILIHMLEACESKHGYACENCVKVHQCRNLHDKLSERASDKLISERVYLEFRERIRLVIDQLSMFN